MITLHMTITEYVCYSGLGAFLGCGLAEVIIWLFLNWWNRRSKKGGA
jgi:hypothetical protein